MIANMEDSENCVENGKFCENGDTVELELDHQYDAKKLSLLNNYDELDSHLNGNGACSGGEYDENDDGSFDTR